MSKEEMIKVASKPINNIKKRGAVPPFFFGRDYKINIVNLFGLLFIVYVLLSRF